MAEKQLWLEPDYFENFRCKGGACRNNCCSGWDIAVGMKDYFRLIGLDCDPQLRHRLECAFRTPDYPTPERYRLISPNWLGRCPLQDDSGLCGLQLGCGEGALPEVCRVYPRSFKREGTNLQACCSCSCEAVVELLMKEDRLRFSLREMDAPVEIGEEAEADIACTIRHCVTLIQDRSMPLRARIQKLCAEFDPEKEFTAGEEGLKILVEVLSEMSSESTNLCGYACPAIDRYGAENGWESYLRDVSELEKRHPDWMRIFENVLANHIVYADFPHADHRIGRRDACAGLCLLYSAMTAVSAAWLARTADENALADALSALFHPVEHSSYYYNVRVLTRGKWALL